MYLREDSTIVVDHQTQTTATVNSYTCRNWQIDFVYDTIKNGQVYSSYNARVGGRCESESHCCSHIQQLILIYMQHLS